MIRFWHDCALPHRVRDARFSWGFLAVRVWLRFAACAYASTSPRSTLFISSTTMRNYDYSDLFKSQFARPDHLSVSNPGLLLINK
jgi:hypothetical protein